MKISKIDAMFLKGLVEKELEDFRKVLDNIELLRDRLKKRALNSIYL